MTVNIGQDVKAMELIRGHAVTRYDSADLPAEADVLAASMKMYEYHLQILDEKQTALRIVLIEKWGDDLRELCHVVQGQIVGGA